jgi:DNA-binding FadR family transcriptional regulator
MSEEKHKKLVRLIRKLAREVAREVIDEHLEEYEHKEKQAKDYEVEN